MTTRQGSQLRERVQCLLGTEDRLALDESGTRELLAGRVPFAEAIVCPDPAAAAAAAAGLGFPVVVKALSPSLLHKSEHGLVVVDCADAATVERAGDAVLRRAQAAGDDAGVHLSVQRQMAGIEFAIGVRRTELGPLCMLAAGGTLIELLDDKAVALAPLDESGAARMLAQLRIAGLLTGYRGRARIDPTPLLELLVAVAALSVEVPELAELDLNPVIVGEHSTAAVDGRCVISMPPPTLDDRVDAASVRRIFEPRRIAIVGASRSRTKVGGLLMHYLRKHAWDGELIAVNPKGGDFNGVPVATSVADIDGPVDLACIAVPSGEVEATVADCVTAGIPSGVIYSAGFAETGEEGALAQERLSVAAEGRFRYVGPNSNGVASPSRRLFATFGMALERDVVPTGPIGLVSQSGAIASSLVSRAEEFGLGFSHWISVGNEADLDLADHLAYLVEDDETRVICLFLEAIRRPRAFAAVARRALALGKPIVAFKSGRSEAGQLATVSHTGALAGSDIAYSAFLERCGVVRVTALRDLLTAAQALLSAGPATGRRVGIVSMSGGACSVVADGCTDAGLGVPPLPDLTVARLRGLLPAYGGTVNPIDVTATGITDPSLVVRTVQLVRESGAVDLVLLQLSTNADPAAYAMAGDLVALRDDDGAVPVLLARLGSERLAPRALDVYRAAGVHVFTWPEQLVEAARACVVYGDLRAAADAGGTP